MLKRTGLCVLVAIAGAAACGSPSTNDFSGPTGQSGQAMGGGSGAEPKGGGPSTGGSSQGGDAGSTTGGSATGGSSTGGTGTGGSSQGLGGSAGDLMAGGGTSGDTATGGTDTGGTGMNTGGTGTDTGGTGTDTGGAGGMPAMGGTSGMGPNCEELAMQYTEALKAAQVCNPNSGKDQCSDKAYSDLTCGCPVAVNPDNADAVAELEQLRKNGVPCREACPAIACIAPGPGTCMRDMGASRDVGHCANNPALPAAN